MVMRQGNNCIKKENMEKNGIYETEIFDISTSGEGIGRVEGIVVFVPGLVPGDKATVEITDIKKNLARGKVVSIDEPSESRVEPVCEHADRCGGCTLQRMDYDAQLRLKEKQLRDKLERIYGGDAPEIEPIIGMDNPWNYRNKAAYSVYAGKAIVQKDGSVKNSERPRVGFFDGKGRNIVECTTCPIQAAPAEKAAEALREYIKQSRISIYDDKTKKGRLRQMVVRTGFESHEVMVVLVLNGKKVPKAELLADLMYDAIDSLNDGVAARLEAAAVEAGFETAFDENGEVFDEVLEATGFDENWYELKSLIVNYNSNRTLAEISTKHDVLYGQPVIRDSSAGMEFEISPFSFYQVNPEQMEKLYDTVLEFADLQGHETVFDLYCGVGTIGLYCAKTAKEVWGIESVKNAVLDANRNAVINGLVNIRFTNGKAEEKIFELEEEGLVPDVVIVDPPRAGCAPELLDAIRKAAPEKLIYVSCDPGTLARDLKLLTAEAEDESAAYKIERIRQIDNFCHSTHVETCCLLRRRA